MTNFITLTTQFATATVSPYGAQVLSFIPTGQPDVLWCTTPEFLTKAETNGKALRGGIPLCWPWFLGLNKAPNAPSHGLGRISQWQVTHHAQSSQKSTVTLVQELDGSHPAWPHKTRGELTVDLTDTLTVRLTTTNLGTVPFKLTQALHTYLNVGNLAQAEVIDLTNLTRRHVSQGTPLPAHHGPFRVQGEVEHLVSPTHSLTLNDAALHRRITVTTTGHEFVVWNPGPEKAQTLDMPPNAYQHMLCLEAAHIDHAPTLQPGESFTLATTLTAQASL